MLALVLVACGSRLPVASTPPTQTHEAAATTPAAPTPRVFRVRWIYLPDRRALVLQQDGFTDDMKAARLRGPTGMVLVSALRHDATPGEPRVCGHPDLVPPYVVTLGVGPEVAEELSYGGSKYTLEVQEDGFGWHATELLDWTRIAGQPCFE
jgi:hypothetical protein